VKERRSKSLTQTDDILFNGEFWTGSTSLDYGIIDGIDDMYSYTRKKFGPDVKFEYIDQKQSMVKRLFGVYKNPGVAEVADEISESFIAKIESKLMHNRFDIK